MPISRKLCEDGNATKATLGSIGAAAQPISRILT
jgi:hypothetical protein